jgi:hypothetical protein
MLKRYITVTDTVISLKEVALDPFHTHTHLSLMLIATLLCVSSNTPTTIPGR